MRNAGCGVGSRGKRPASGVLGSQSAFGARAPALAALSGLVLALALRTGGAAEPAPAGPRGPADRAQQERLAQKAREVLAA